MIFELNNPGGVHRGATSYSHAAVIPAGARRVIVSGQVGAGPDGATADDPGVQIEQAYRNLESVLAAQGLGLTDVVKTTVFLTDRSHIAPYREIRARIMGHHAPASTLLIVAGLADPRYVVEIEAEAVGEPAAAGQAEP